MKIRIIFWSFLVLFSHQLVSQSTASKQVTKFIIEAPQLDTVKTIWVYLPKLYQNSQNAYPVYYMHDGQNLFDDKTSYVGEWKIDEYLDSIISHEIIVIGIEHGNEKRIDELTPYKNEKYGGGNGINYISFIKNTLKPHIDITYRTLSDSKNTTIFGSSLGGLISFYAAIKFPKTFGKAGIFSPAFWINKEIFELIKDTEIDKDLRFFFLIGTEEGEDVVTDLETMVDLLIKYDFYPKNIKNKIIEGGQHNEAFWSSHFPEAHQWLERK